MKKYGSSGKCRDRLMDEVESQFEIGLIPEAVRLSFEDFDFVVEPFEGTGGDAMPEITQEAGVVFLEGVREFDEMFQADCPCLIDPGFEEGACDLSVREIPKHPEILFQQIGLVQRFVDLHQFHETFQ